MISAALCVLFGLSAGYLKATRWNDASDLVFYSLIAVGAVVIWLMCKAAGLP
jgi:hypothetical protein